MMVEQSAIEVKSHCLNVGHATKANSAIGIRQKRSIPALTPTMTIKCATRRSVSRRNPPPKLNRAETRVVGIRRSAG